MVDAPVSGDTFPLAVRPTGSFAQPGPPVHSQHHCRGPSAAPAAVPWAACVRPQSRARCRCRRTAAPGGCATHGWRRVPLPKTQPATRSERSDLIAMGVSYGWTHLLPLKCPNTFCVLFSWVILETFLLYPNIWVWKLQSWLFSIRIGTSL